MKFGTKAIHAAQEPCPVTGAIMTPIYQTSTFVQEEPGKHKGYEYSRTGNPTRTALEKNIAELEQGKHGLAYASGLAAIDNIISLLKKGDHVISCDDVYGGTFRLFEKVKKKFGLEFSWVDMTDVNNLKKVIRPNTRMIWVETPTNPLLKLIDIKAVAEIAKQNKIITVVDNTFMSPYFQNPLLLGADISVHSTTKYLNGHSDVVGGALATNDEKIFEELKFLQNAIGAVPGPFDCWLVLRGIKTLHVRMKQHEENAKKIAEYLQKHHKVKKVIYPGLKSHPQHKLAKKQMLGFGGMISFEIKGGVEDVNKFLKNVKIFSLAESLGGVESLIEHPAIMTHASLPKEVREKIGISDGLIRLSVGIEDVDDLINGLDNAFRLL